MYQTGFVGITHSTIQFFRRFTILRHSSYCVPCMYRVIIHKCIQIKIKNQQIKVNCKRSPLVPLVPLQTRNPYSKNGSPKLYSLSKYISRCQLISEVCIAQNVLIQTKVALYSRMQTRNMKVVTSFPSALQKNRKVGKSMNDAIKLWIWTTAQGTIFIWANLYGVLLNADSS